MSDRKICKQPDCPLDAASVWFPTLPEGAKGDLCWQHQPREIRSLEREKRRAKYKAWYISTQPWRRDYWGTLEVE